MQIATAALAGATVGAGLSVVPVLAAAPHPADAQISAQQLSGSAAVGRGWTASVATVPDLVAVRWQGDRAARYAVQTRRADGRWRTVTEVGAQGEHAPDPGTLEAERVAARGPVASEPVWVGRARVQCGSGWCTEPHTTSRSIASRARARTPARSPAHRPSRCRASSPR